MSTFTFEDKDILNTTLLPGQPNDHSYTTSTTSGFLGRKVTTLAPFYAQVLSGELGGSINWRENTFEIGGLTKKRSDLKTKAGGIFSSTREWRWSGKRYTIKYYDEQWVAMPDSDSSEPSLSAIFTIRKTPLFSEPQPAFISFSPETSTEDMVFLILVMIYSETKRWERNKTPSQVPEDRMYKRF